MGRAGISPQKTRPRAGYIHLGSDVEARGKDGRSFRARAEAQAEVAKRVSAGIALYWRTAVSALDFEQPRRTQRSAPANCFTFRAQAWIRAGLDLQIR